ncbi:MAG: hypothetical protein AAGK37_16755 [Pseudomonadota bacterium]
MKIGLFSWVGAAMLFAASSVSADLPLKYFNDLSGPHYLLGGVYAFEFRENDVPGLKRVRATYLPNGTLLYPIDLDPEHEPKNVSSPERYGTYITQFGQVLLVENDEVSKRPFSVNLGEADVIFHQDTFICAATDELKCSEDDGISVSKSWAMLSERDLDERIVTLRFFITEDNQERVGYLGLERFEEMKRQGVLSDLLEPWPRYAFLGRRELAQARKPCGVARKTYDTEAVKAEIGVEAEVGLLDWFKAKFAAGFETEAGEENIVLVGEPDTEIRLYELRVVKPDTEGKFDPNRLLKLNVTASYGCDGIAGALQPYRIETIIVQHTHPNEIDGRGRVTMKWTDFHNRELAPEEAEYIWDKNRQRPFAFSVNSSVAYDTTIQKLRTRTEFDLALTNILLSAFNASCDSAGGARATCEDYLR